MDTRRAQEIVEGNQNIEVEHNGVKVWIDKVDDQAETAMVHPIQQPANTEYVPLKQLSEVK